MDAKQMTRNITAAKVKAFLNNARCEDIYLFDHKLVTFTCKGEQCEARRDANGRWNFVLIDLDEKVIPFPNVKALLTYCQDPSLDGERL
jgi:hypothetical protein